MTWRDLRNYLNTASDKELDGVITVLCDNSLYQVDDLRISNGQSEYLYNGELFIVCEESPMDKKQTTLTLDQDDD
jgi:hypothetical protein